MMLVERGIGRNVVHTISYKMVTGKAAATLHCKNAVSGIYIPLQLTTGSHRKAPKGLYYLLPQPLHMIEVHS